MDCCHYLGACALLLFLQLLVLLELFCPDSSGLVSWMHVLAFADLVAEAIPLAILTLAHLTSSTFMFPFAVLDT